MWFKCCWTFSSCIQKVERLTKFFFLFLVLLVDYIFLTTFYGLYFNHQLHVKLNNFFKFLHVSWWPTVGSFHVMHLHLSFWLVGYQVVFLADFALVISCPCWDLNPGPPRYQADMLPTELSWLGFFLGYKNSCSRPTPAICPTSTVGTRAPESSEY